MTEDRLVIYAPKTKKTRPVSLILVQELLDKLEREYRLSDDTNEHILKAHDGFSPYLSRLSFKEDAGCIAPGQASLNRITLTQAYICCPHTAPWRINAYGADDAWPR